MSIKHDRPYTRTPQDIERKYPLGKMKEKIEENAKKAEEALTIAGASVKQVLEATVTITTTCKIDASLVKKSGIRYATLILNQDVAFYGSTWYGPYLCPLTYFNGTDWVDTSTLTGRGYSKGQSMEVEYSWNEETAALNYIHILNLPGTSTSTTTNYDTKWYDGTSAIAGLVPQYKTNGNLVTVRFDTDGSDDYAYTTIANGTLLGTLDGIYIDPRDQAEGTSFLVTGYSHSSIYKIKIVEDQIYYGGVVYGGNYLHQDIFDFQFTYSFDL